MVFSSRKLSHDEKIGGEPAADGDNSPKSKRTSVKKSRLNSALGVSSVSDCLENDILDGVQPPAKNIRLQKMSKYNDILRKNKAIPEYGTT